MSEKFQKKFQQKISGFGQIQKSVMKSQELTHQSKSLYSYLCSILGHDEYCFPRIDTMATDLMVNRKWIFKYLSELESFGILQKSKLNLKSSSNQNKYIIMEISPNIESICAHGPLEGTMSEKSGKQQKRVHSPLEGTFHSPLEGTLYNKEFTTNNNTTTTINTCSVDINSTGFVEYVYKFILEENKTALVNIYVDIKNHRKEITKSVSGYRASTHNKINNGERPFSDILDYVNDYLRIRKEKELLRKKTEENKIEQENIKKESKRQREFISKIIGIYSKLPENKKVDLKIRTMNHLKSQPDLRWWFIDDRRAEMIPKFQKYSAMCEIMTEMKISI